MSEIDEAEIFKGAENSLKMKQTYTHAFQCVYKLSQYPFDSQVILFKISFNLTFARFARLRWCPSSLKPP